MLSHGVAPLEYLLSTIIASPCLKQNQVIFFNVHRYIFKRTHIYRGLDTKQIKENKVIYKNINRRTKKYH